LTEKVLYTRNEAAHLLSVSIATLDRLIANKFLLVRRVGRRVLIHQGEIMKFARKDTPVIP
jgi:excisionase family DNA binding protein